MRLYLLGLLFLSLPLLADDSINFQNDREGESYYANFRATKRSIHSALKKLSQNEILEAFRDGLSGLTPERVCAYDLHEAFQENLKQRHHKFDEFTGAYHILRAENELDDVSLKILLRANEVSQKEAYPPRFSDYSQSHRYLPHRGHLDQMLELLVSFDEKFLKKHCFDEAYKKLHSEISKIQDLNSKQLEAVYLEAYKERLIDLKDWQLLERGRLYQIEKDSFGLSEYYKKKKGLRTQYPLRDPEERSRFATQNQNNMSRRQRLLENYSDLQIIIMGNVIKKLRSRLESNKIEILVYDQDEIKEVIPLEPMERFRFAIKLLRKEMGLLTLNTYFGGRTPTYMDLMTASYETGIIPAEELDEIAGLEEIWNPKKTFWEKASVWVRTFSSVATVVTPPPYGFIPVLALVVIEATAGNKDSNNNADTSLF